MPRRTTALTAVLAAAAVAAGMAPAAASAERPAPTEDKALKADQGTPPVTTGRPDGAGDGRKN